MNTSSTPKNSTPEATTDKTSTVESPKPTDPSEPLALKPPKLLFPTLATLISAGLLLFLIYSPSAHSGSTTINIFIDMLHFALIPLTPTLGLFLLHRLLEVIIIHRAFRPNHLFAIATILFSASIYYYVIELLIISIVLYLVASVVFAASLSFQKTHSLTTDPAYFRSSLLSASVASTVLGFINLLILAFQIIPTDLPYQISGPLFNILFSVSVIAILPIQLCLTFLTLGKLTPARRTNLLSRANFLIISLSLLLTVTTSIAYLAYFEHIITEEYSHYQPCCQQPTYYED